MTQHPFPPVAPDPEPDKGTPLPAHTYCSQCGSVVSPFGCLCADPLLLGMRIGNLIYATVFGIERQEGK